MENRKIAVLLVVLLVGVGLGYAWGNSQAASPPEYTHMMHGGTMMSDYAMDMTDAMQGMMSGISGLSGDSFDKAFLSEMIMHHEGAVLMAKSALKNAKHEEIKSMANDIITAQTREIDQMKAWQKSWYNY